MRQSSASVRNERGAALLWTLMSVLVVAMLGVAAYYLSSQDRLIGENFEYSYRAVYTADNALSEYYATFLPSNDLTLPPVESTVVDADSAEAEEDDGGVIDSADEYDGADLVVRSFPLAGATVWITPTKTTEAKDGDVYLLEAVAQLTDVRNRPAATRALRTFAQLSPPVKALAALTAPNGLTATNSPPSDHLHLDGKRKNKCGAGAHISAIAAPSGTTDLKSKKLHLKPDDDPNVADTSSTDSYQELRDSMGVDWSILSNPLAYADLTNVIEVPGDYASLNAIPFNTFNKNATWPIIRVDGDVNLTSEVKGFGMLVITGGLTMTAKLDWRGVVLLGKAFDVKPGTHLHVHGLMATGLGCTNAELANAAGVPPFCRNRFEGAHLGIKYQQCDVEAAWSQMLILRPLTPSRHTTMF